MGAILYQSEKRENERRVKKKNVIIPTCGTKNENEKHEHEKDYCELRNNQ